MSSATDRPLTDARLAYLFLLVRDFDAMVAFYRDALGLEPAYLTAGRNAFFRTGGGGPLVALYPGREGRAETAGHWLMAFDVADLEAVVAGLRARGVAVGEIQDVPFGRAARLEDPEGNRIEVHQPDAPG